MFDDNWLSNNDKFIYSEEHGRIPVLDVKEVTEDGRIVFTEESRSLGLPHKLFSCAKIDTTVNIGDVFYTEPLHVKHTVGHKERQELLCRILWDLDTDIIFGTGVALKIRECDLFKACELLPPTPIGVTFKIGTLSDKNVLCDPNMNFNDLRILDTKGNELLDLEKFGFSAIDI